MLSRLRALFGNSDAGPVRESPHVLPSVGNIDALMADAFGRQQAGDGEGAEAVYRKVLSLSPAHSEATHRLGILLAQRGDHRQAEPYLRSATLLLGCSNPACFINFGNTLTALERFSEAIEAYRKSIACAPTVEGYIGLGIALRSNKQLDEARQSYLHALDLRQDAAEIHNGLAVVESDLGHPEEAIRHAEKAQHFDPQSPHAYNTCGFALFNLGRYEEAIDQYHLAISRYQDYAIAYNNLGMVLMETGKRDAAFAAFETALKFGPTDNIHTNYGLALLKYGDFERGLAEHEYRFHRKRGEKLVREDRKAPLWHGESLRGRDVLLYAEQGLGDTIQFVRYVPRIAALGARKIYLEVQPALERLVRSVEGASAVFPFFNAKLPSFDFHCSLMSLPHRLNTRLETIPADVPYLSVPDAMVDFWRERLTSLCGLKVGLVWAGNPENPADVRRSVSAEQMRALLEIPGIAFVSLQKLRQDSPAAICDDRLHDWMDECNDFLDTAALIANLDLVVTVDTSAAHLAGALAKPVWMLNRFDTDWRWLQDRNDSPWYPTMRLFRQDRVGDWSAPLARLRMALVDASRQFAEERRFVNPPPLPVQDSMLDVATLEASEAAKNEGNAAYGKGDMEEAERRYLKAIALNPEYAEAHNNLALVLRACGEDLEAEKHLLRAIATKPDLTNAHFNLGCLFADQGRTGQAIDQFRKTVALAPDYFAAHAELGSMLGRQGDLDEAERHLLKALELDPQSVKVYGDLSNLFLERGDTDRALVLAKRSIEMDPAFAEGHSILGGIFGMTGQLDMAVAELRQAIALEPGLDAARYNLASYLMLAGDYENGFSLYESRKNVPDFMGMPAEAYGSLMEAIKNIQSWDGGSLEGRSVLVWQEQGFGDLIMMLRYLPFLLKKGASGVTLQCTPSQAFLRLVSAMRDGERIRVIDYPDIMSSRFNVQCSQMSLPFCFGTRVETIPNDIPYLRVPQEISGAWQDRLKILDGLKVGLVWCGNPNNRADAQRSIPLDRLAPLLAVEGVSFISLQKLLSNSPMAIRTGVFHDWMRECKDFLDTAALIENLDLVIAVDTAVAHLAGALGKPVWLLNRRNTDWRWFLDREDSPWYPTMRIFRQTQRGVWDDVILKVAQELANRAKQLSG